jgi:hypothetical protein
MRPRVEKMSLIATQESDRWELVKENAITIRDFLEWSERCEARPGWSMRWRARPDLVEAREMVPLFDEPWWAVIVYSCFNSMIGTRAAAAGFHGVVPFDRVDAAIHSLDLPQGAIGMHRIQPGHAGARNALRAACVMVDSFQRILFEGVGFDDRYTRIRALNAPSWGRTTCYDLLLRSGAIGVAGGAQYEPEYAYLGGSTGPSRGFTAIWGVPIDATNVLASEALLGWWSTHWDTIAERVGATSRPQPEYGPADFENALCLYQDELRAQARRGSG